MGDNTKKSENYILSEQLHKALFGLTCCKAKQRLCLVFCSSI
ncbi:hypothetical protein U471_28250 [Bacillus sp. CN2]|nr:hypothetical protein U471_28250 [Bacillus amyloliquefaciens CC178]QEY90754.1 hypothetical protein BACIT_2894 [Bacillus amyloliquefaciens]RAP20463.1 hypothetical protein C2W63_02197 [Bacillus velezensis]GFR55522.1 hypothetical protein U471_28250 [Bacillus sp. CN2]QEY94511.1 hypothetical protein BACIH_2804 [Bacillus amyloliquefaciens]